MNKFSGKYELLAEAALTRYQQGGFLIGDYVKVKKNALNNEKIKGMSDQYKDRIKQFKDGDVKLRISAVKNKYPDSSLGIVGSPDMPVDSYVDVVQEISPANWVNPMTIPMDAVELSDTDNESNFGGEIPDNVKRPSPEPTEFDKDGTAKGDMGAEEFTRMSKDLNLATKNTKLANSNKWSDDKPGAGNTKGVTKPKKLNDSVKINDEKMLSEAYTSIFEGGVPAVAPTEPPATGAPTLDSVASRLGITVDELKQLDPVQLNATITKVFPQEKDPQKIQAAADKIRGMVNSSYTANDIKEIKDQFANEPGISEPGGYMARTNQQTQSAKSVMNQQDRSDPDMTFNQQIRLQQMKNDQKNAEARQAAQNNRDQMSGSRYNRGRDTDNMYNAYQQSQWQQPQEMQPWQGQQSQQDNRITYQSENPNAPDYVDPMRSSPRTQSQTWSNGSQGFGGQLGNILQNTGLNTAEGAGTGLANSIGGAVGNVVNAAGRGLGDRVYRSTSGNRNNSGSYNSSGQRSRYQSVGGQPRNR